MINRTLARLRLCRMQMRRKGMLVLQGKRTFTDSAHTDIRKTFARVRKERARQAAKVVTPIRKRA